MLKPNLGKLKYILNMCIYQIHAVNSEKKLQSDIIMLFTG